MTGIASRDLRSTEKNLGTDKGPRSKWDGCWIEFNSSLIIWCINHSGIVDEPDRIIDMTDLGGT